MSKHPPRRSAILIALGISVALPALGQVTVDSAWVRGTVPGQKATGAFMQLTSPTDTALVGATSPLAKVVEIHAMKTEGGVMKMSAVDRIAVPAGKPVELKPGGYHVMLFDLQRPVTQGDTVPLTLTFEDKGGKKTTVDVAATVRALGTASPTPRY